MQLPQHRSLLLLVHLHPVAGKSVAELSWEFATHPSSCFELSGEENFEGACVWLIYDRLATWPELADRYGQKSDFTLLCVLGPGSPGPVVRRCRARRRANVLAVYPGRGRTTVDNDDDEVSLYKKLREDAVEVELIGDVPDGCLRLPTRGLVCQWSLLQTTPGWQTVARWGEMPSKKLRLVCRFPSATGPRGADSCKVSLID